MAGLAGAIPESKGITDSWVCNVYSGLCILHRGGVEGHSTTEDLHLTGRVFISTANRDSIGAVDADEVRPYEVGSHMHVSLERTEAWQRHGLERRAA
jgi:hypothetical protein